jgi:hypothetical protein
MARGLETGRAPFVLQNTEFGFGLEQSNNFCSRKETQKSQGNFSL